jgi:hypothetical protein
MKLRFASESTSGGSYITQLPEKAKIFSLFQVAHGKGHPHMEMPLDAVTAYKCGPYMPGCCC